MVRTSGSSTSSTQPSSPRLAPRCSQDARSRRAGLVDQLLAQGAPHRPELALGDGVDGLPAARLLDEVATDGPSRRARAPRGPTQVGACTPLVTEVIGTSSVSKPGHSPLNMPRLTSPCSLATPLARWARRRPMTAMLKTVGVAAVVGLRAEREHPVDGDAGTGVVAAEVLLDELAREAVDARGHRRVRGEDRAGADRLDAPRRRSGRRPRSARGCARGRGSRRAPRWCGRPRARAPGDRGSTRGSPARRRCRAASPGAAGARRRRRRAGR